MRTAQHISAKHQRKEKPRCNAGLELMSGFWRPDRTPAVGVHHLARENLARPPGVAVRTLHQCAVGTTLACSRVGPRCRIDTARIVRVLHGLAYRVILAQVRHVLRLCVCTWTDETACRCNSRQLNECAPCNFAQRNLLKLPANYGAGFVQRCVC